MIVAEKVIKIYHLVLYGIVLCSFYYLEREVRT